MKGMLTLRVTTPNDNITNTIIAQTNGTTIGNLSVHDGIGIVAVVAVDDIVAVGIGICIGSRQLQKSIVGKGIFRRVVIVVVVVVGIVVIVGIVLQFAILVLVLDQVFLLDRLKATIRRR
jgi:hypothetical protein